MEYYGIKNACKMAFYKKSDGSLAAYFPFGNSINISVTGDKVEATAQGYYDYNLGSKPKSYSYY